MNIGKFIEPVFASGRRRIIFIIILFVLNVVLYIGTVGHDFLKDDFRLIVENPRIKNFRSFIDSIDSKFFSFPDFPYLHYWRPLSLFSFFIDYSLWELDPRGYHLSNILINAFNALLIFLVFYALFNKIHIAFTVSAFFSLHPSHVEAVSWISGRTDLLASFFILLAALFFVLFLKKRRWFFYALSAFFFIPALLSKENSILFPMLALGLVFAVPTLEKGKRLKNALLTLPFWMINLVYIILHHRFSGVREVMENVSFTDIFVVFKTIGAYAKIILVPFFPTHHFSMYRFEQDNLQFLLYFAAALLILLFIMVNRKKYRYSIHSLWFLIFLLPVLDPELVPTHPQIALRFAYIPAVFAGVFFIDTFYFFKNKGLKILYTILLGCAAAVWMIEAVTFQSYFKNQHTHYTGLVRYYPDDCSLLLPLALRKAREGDYNRALALVNHALEVDEKDRWVDISQMGGLLKANLLVIAGDPHRGKALAEKILKETREKGIKYFGFLVLAKFHEKKGDLLTALRMLEDAENIGETADLYSRMVRIYIRMENYSTALRCLEKAKRLNPGLKKYREFKDFLLIKTKR